MAKAEDILLDDYMNFAVLEGLFAPTWTDLNVLELNTGMSIDAQIAWEIWQVEFYLPNIHDMVGDNVQAKLSLATKQYATFPTLKEKGVIAVGGPVNLITTSGQSSPKNPDTKEFRPPVITAARKLYLHVQGSATLTTMNADPVECRIGFTKARLPKDKMIELLQTWENVG